MSQGANRSPDQARKKLTSFLPVDGDPVSTPEPVDQPGLWVGAAKIDITPPPDLMPARLLGVNDPIHVRAVVLDDEGARAAFVSVDLIGLTDAVWSEVSRRVEDQHGIEADHLILTATHTHSVPSDLGPSFVDAIVDSVGQAAAGVRPALLAAGSGTCHINVNRNLFDPVTHRWREGRNDHGPSDKRVSVLRFTDRQGEPIAVVFNYAVHAVVTGMLDQISADIPGAAATYIEDSLGPDTVALFTSGCAGDQNPLYYQQTFDLRARRVCEHTARGIDIANSMPAGGEGLDRDDPTVARLMDEQRSITSSLGVMLAEEVLDVVRTHCDRPRSSVTISGRHRTISLPGRRRTDTGRAGQAGTYVDAALVPLRVGLLHLDDIAIGVVDAELFTEIGLRFRQESPARHSLVCTLSNGRAPSGYVASNSAGGFHTFEVLSSHLRPGYAETAIVDGLIDLLDDVRKAGSRSTGQRQASIPG